MMNAITPTVTTPQIGLLVTLSVAAFVHTLSVPYVIVLSGLGLLRAQLVAAVATAATNLALSVVLASWIELTGPALAAVLCQTCLFLVPMTFVIRRRLQSDAKRADPAFDRSAAT
jgi:O-antigen/teichoic acid export membrane protein